MLDCHIHLERGPYTIAWLNKFVETAAGRGLDEIWLLEHSHRFDEFYPMYESVRGYSGYQKDWIDGRNGGDLPLKRYTDFVDRAKQRSYPLKVRFGLEVCYFEEHESLIKDVLGCYPFDFVTGSVHWIDGFGFDHKKEFWDDIDADHTYKRYYELMRKLIESGLFAGVAHPDSIKAFGHKPSYDLRSTYDVIAELLLKHHIYAEQSGGLHLNYGEGRELGMNAKMLRALLEKGVKVLTASDAHRPEDAGANIAALQKIINQSGPNERGRMP